MPRPRKPTQLHIIQGTLRSHHKDREGEPHVEEPLGGPPRSWHGPGKALWCEIADLIPPEVAKKADRLLVELLCRLIRQMRDEAKPVTPALASQIRACLASLGMTPADRSRVAGPAYAEPDDADRFFRPDP